MTNPTVSTANNRFASGQGYSYDLSGNTTADALGRTYIYDAENKQVEVLENSVSLGKYFYDGDGKRVKKISDDEVVIFVYDAVGKLVAEYANQISQTPTISYLTNDHLGSPRITTDQLGQIISRRDFMPFGEEIYQPNYGADTVRQKFTGYERDNETGLDFAQARYFNSGFGRFSSPDDFGNDTDVTDPRSWNLYVYVRNNPLKYIDPSGEEIWITFQEEEEYEENGEKKKRYVTRRVQYKDGSLYNQDGSGYTGSNEYALSALNYLNTLSQDEDLNHMIGDLVGSSKIHNIMIDPNDSERNETVTTEDGTTIYWSGKSAAYKDNKRNKLWQPAIFSFAHELLGHAWFIDQGRERRGSELVYTGLDRTGHSTVSIVDLNEIDAVSVENIAHRLLGSSERVYAFETDISEYLKYSFVGP